MTLKRELQRLSELLDSINYELYGSVYTLEDDEFSTVFYVRDQLDRIIEAQEWETE